MCFLWQLCRVQASVQQLHLYQLLYCSLSVYRHWRLREVKLGHHLMLLVLVFFFACFLSSSSQAYGKVIPPSLRKFHLIPGGDRQRVWRSSTAHQQGHSFLFSTLNCLCLDIREFNLDYGSKNYSLIHTLQGQKVLDQTSESLNSAVFSPTATGVENQTASHAVCLHEQLWKYQDIPQSAVSGKVAPFGNVGWISAMKFFALKRRNNKKQIWSRIMLALWCATMTAEEGSRTCSPKQLNNSLTLKLSPDYSGLLLRPSSTLTGALTAVIKGKNVAQTPKILFIKQRSHG